MADISKVKYNGTDYPVNDAVSHEEVNAVASPIYIVPRPDAYASETDGLYLFVSGGINPSTGANNATSFNSTRMRSAHYWNCSNKKGMMIKGVAGYEFVIWLYSSAAATSAIRAAVVPSYVEKEYYYVDLASGENYFRVAFQRADKAELTTSLNDPTSDYYKVHTGFAVFYPCDLSGLTDEIPEYWRNEINTRIEDIQTASDDSGMNGDQFVFITDYHIPRNSNISPALIKKIVDECGIGRVFFGGDILTSEESVEDALARIAEFPVILKKIWDKTFCIIGNHEFNNPSADSSKVSLMPTVSQIYSIICKDKEHEYGSVSNRDGFGSYWVDNAAQKIRYFFVGMKYDSGFSGVDKVWMFEEFEKIPDGYTVVIISHGGLGESGSGEFQAGFQPIADAMDALNSHGTYYYSYNSTTYDFRNTNVVVAAALTGHKHRDDILLTTGGIPVFCTTCDCVPENSETRSAGTITEQAFDVVHLDTANRTIKLFRIGYGSDRTASY